MRARTGEDCVADVPVRNGALEVERSLEGGLIYYRSITRDGQVANARVVPLTEGPRN